MIRFFVCNKQILNTTIALLTDLMCSLLVGWATGRIIPIAYTLRKVFVKFCKRFYKLRAVTVVIENGLFALYFLWLHNIVYKRDRREISEKFQT